MKKGAIRNEIEEGEKSRENEQENIMKAMKANSLSEATYLAESYIWCMYLNICN